MVDEASSKAVEREMGSMRDYLKSMFKSLKGGTPKMPRRDYKELEDDDDIDDQEDEDLDDEIEKSAAPVAQKNIAPRKIEQQVRQDADAERVQTKKQSEQKQNVQVVEREINLGLINEKLNFIISQLFKEE